jgi:hypothetical protein
MGSRGLIEQAKKVSIIDICKHRYKCQDIEIDGKEIEGSFLDIENCSTLQDS